MDSSPTIRPTNSCPVQIELQRGELSTSENLEVLQRKKFARLQKPAAGNPALTVFLIRVNVNPREARQGRERSKRIECSQVLLPPSQTRPVARQPSRSTSAKQDLHVEIGKLETGIKHFRKKVPMHFRNPTPMEFRTDLLGIMGNP